MAPVPLEGHQTPVGSTVTHSPGGGSISLSMLIDFIVQRTYHELTVLSELLRSKTDRERKIEIFQFAGRTRQLFVRLLALVKWANSASKVDKSATIMSFLDKQSLLFVETADMMSRMAREALVHARLPNFHLPAAVEVLTTGTYGHLPICIRDRIVPSDPITPQEKRSTLLRLNQVIQYRLVTTTLPAQMRNLQIENGRVKFLVEHEFEMSLTVMGDGMAIPWRLLDIDILVEDKETGDGKALVHSLQVNYIHQLIQSRLMDNPQPLHELYNILHSFCQSLQLEVLHSQTVRLCRDRLGDYIRVEEYLPGKCLTVSYWRELMIKDPKSELGYRLTVQVDPHDPSRPLMVIHTPSLGSKDSELAERAIRTDHLSMERLLVHTIYVRTKCRLIELKQEIQSKVGGDIECTLQGSPAVLNIPILLPCLRSEQLLVTVDTHTGMLLVHVPQYDTPLVAEIQQTLNGDKSRLDVLVMELRFWITQRRVEKTLQHLPASSFERLPLLHHSDHPIGKIERHRMFIKFHKHPNSILIVEFKEKPGSPCEIEHTFYLTTVKPASIEDDPKDDSIETEIPKVYLKVLTLIEFDTFVMTHGPYTKVDVQDHAERILGKRKAAGKEPPTKRAKLPPYIIPDLAHVVGLCDERTPFAALASELSRRDVVHKGLQVEANGISLVLKLVQLPPVEGVDKSLLVTMQKSLLSAAIRIQGRAPKAWLVEFVFYNSPLQSTHSKEQGLCRPVYFTYDMLTVDNMSKTVDSLLSDWAQIVHLYGLVQGLADYMKQEKLNLSSMATVKSYNYSKLILSYGTSRCANVTVQWQGKEKKFKLIFGASGPIANNPHSIVRTQLELHLNKNQNLAFLIKILNETYEPLLSTSKLPTSPHLGVINQRPMVAVLTFTLLPQSPTHIRVAYHNMYCLDIHLRGEGLVSVRDGAYSLFDKSKVIEEFTPTQGLKAFLSKYVDENAISRRRSQSEDDNPPSPITVDHLDPHFLSSTHHPGSPAQREGLRFHTPLTPPSGSNPHTPASPHTGSISQAGQHQSFGSSPATSFMASPPSLPPNVNPSPSMLPHASPGPGNILANSPGNPLHVPSPGILPTPSPTQAGQMQVGHSPASTFIGQTGHPEGSPFPSSQSMSSPAPSGWPGSPSMPRPSPRPGQSPVGHAALHSPQADQKQATSTQSSQSRVLPQRSWAAAIPTLLTHEAFDVICTPALHPQNQTTSGPMMSPLERFLGCVYMRRHLQRVIQTEECLQSVQNTEPGVIQFKVETLQCKVGISTQHLQSLHLKLTPEPKYETQWAAEELQVLERFFDVKVMAPPFRPNALLAFGRLLNASIRILKDCIQLMRLELVPGLAQQQQMKWSVEWCLTIPPSPPPIMPAGMAAVLMIRNKMLFFLQITSIGDQTTVGMEPPSLVLPIVYDVSMNITQLAEKRDQGTASATTAVASQQLKRFADFGAQSNECSIFPAVRDLLVNLNLPMEGVVLSTMMQGPGPGQGPMQPGFSPGGGVPMGQPGMIS